MLERTGKHRKVTWTVVVNTMPGRRMRWTFTTSTGLTGTGTTTYGIETAHKDGQNAAEEAIDAALDG